ncbi:hypothetical protein Mco01_48100 [Microbispora corallina]|uniref:Major facilitator superfamily (MFS) profile domain-containing protein n=1 Tax=Microbispora corallina TaxID=83302 RepID=A0ABQ4G450_9ACTN|nr:MFS transporter [Microbispora corallina]GIH41810.1 hypothetical protein Mco01_48100 [Microbispora corallina]
MTDIQKRLAGLGCLLTLVLAVLDMNIVSAATVAIVRDLDPAHGLDHLAWLVTAYALAATAALPLYGKLCDVYGAKAVYLAAVTLFLTGSALCGTAGSMTWLIVFRALQGIGGGGLMSVTIVVLAFLAPPEDRGRAGGMGGIVAGVGIVAGPLLGGLLVDHLSWRWIFYVNLPLGLAVLATGALALRLPRQGTRRRIDYLGAALSAAAAVVLLLVTEWAGRDYAWGSPTILSLIAADAVLVGAFVWRQARAAEPILPLGLFRDRVVGTALPLQFLAAFAGLTGPIVYTMIYLQAVKGVAAADAGLYLIPLAAGMTAAGLVSGALQGRGAGMTTFLVTGSAVTAVAVGLLSLLRTGTATPVLLADLFLLGVGQGQVVGTVVMLVQDAVPVSRLGVATTAIRFAQTLGSAVGTAVFGVILSRVTDSGSGDTRPSIAAMGALPPAARRRAAEALVSGVDAVFLTAAGVMLVALALAVLLRARRAEPVSPVPALTK